jgi:preprotein translocase SecE subunit
MARNRQRNRTRRPLRGPGLPVPAIPGDGGGKPPIEDDPLVAFDDGDDEDDGVSTAAAAFGAPGASPARRGRTNPITWTIEHLEAVWAELRRVQWPDRQQVAQATGVVLGFVLLVAVFLGVSDFVAGKLINAIL